MKKWLILCGALGVAAALAAGGACAASGMAVVRKIWFNELDKRGIEWKIWDRCGRNLPVAGRLEHFLQNKTFVILLQNSNEIRPSGGFMGSFVKVRTGERGIESWAIEDIYEPDGKIKGHVSPPYPIQEAFLQGWWRLRDSNWEIDFSEAAADIVWFFEQGGVREVEGVAAVNLNLLKKVLEVTGPVKLMTYDEIVSGKNLDLLAQKYSRENFRPGRSQKRDFLGAVAVALQSRWETAGWREYLELARLLWEELSRGEILLWFKDTQAQRQVASWGWTGEIKMRAGENFLYLVEANLGANKANCCMSKNIGVRVSGGREEVEVLWRNENQFEMAIPPWFWGGDYLAYARMVRPAEAKVRRVEVNGLELRPMPEELAQTPPALRQKISEEYFSLETRNGYQVLGFWVKCKAGGEARARVETETQPGHRTWRIRRQPGEPAFKYRYVFEGVAAGEGWLEGKEARISY